MFRRRTALKGLGLSIRDLSAFYQSHAPKRAAPAAPRPNSAPAASDGVRQSGAEPGLGLASGSAAAGRKASSPMVVLARALVKVPPDLLTAAVREAEAHQWNNFQ